MEQDYWLGRTRTSSAMAEAASCAEARLAHLELAGRYSIMAAVAGRRFDEADVGAPFGGSVYYERLETGARWLASHAPTAAEHREHLGMANRYARLGGAADRRMPS
jgi:hypothetical protein